jgi:hypothetical protein
MNHWHLIYTKSHQEKVALDNFTRQNYQCYLSWIYKAKITQGKKILSKEPMFPRYLFEHLKIKRLGTYQEIVSQSDSAIQRNKESL